MKKNLLWATALGVVLGGVGFASIKSVFPAANAQTPNVTAPSMNVRTVAATSSVNMGALKDLDQSFSALAEFVSPTVVQIRSKGNAGNDIFGRSMGEVGGVGTGVVFRSDGWIVTNDHVVGGFNEVTVVLPDGREFKGEVRRASDSDIAVVKINASNLTAASFADSDKVKPGQFTMAVGSPFDLDKTVTFGHVSAEHRVRQIADERLPKGFRLYPDLLQTDAAINQGNSGGPLFNIDGEVIGINSAIASTTGGSNGIGFAIPANLARMLAETLIEKGKVVRGALGLVPEDIKPYKLKEMKLDGGAVVTYIDNDTPAARAGIKKDDVLLRIGTTNIRNQMDVRMSMYKYPPGTSVPVEVLRDGQHKTFNVVSIDPEKLDKQVGQQQPQQRQDNGGNQEDNNFQFPKSLDDFFNRQRQQQQQDEDTVPPVRQGQATLGVKVVDAEASSRKTYSIPATVSGAIVTAVDEGSVADKTGLDEGCIITKIDGKSIANSKDLQTAIRAHKWGDKVHIEFSKFDNGMTMSQSRDVIFR